MKKVQVLQPVDRGDGPYVCGVRVISHYARLWQLKLGLNVAIEEVDCLFDSRNRLFHYGILR